MKAVVIGGTGLIGARIVDHLRRRGHQVTAASPRSGVDTVTGEGLAAALAGASVVIDVSNSPSNDAATALAFFEASGRNLLAAEAAAGVGHHVALSIVGADRVPGQGYFRAKIAQEALIEASGIAYTIVRSTQFMEFLPGIADVNTAGDTVRLPAGLLQPIAADDVAAFVSDVAAGDPRNATVEIAGPERASFADMVGRYLKTIGDPRAVVQDPEARYFGGRLANDSLVPLGEARLGRLDLETWASRS
jgi:uncharacterized protein YbjT (DUF2867 family)